MPRKNGSRALAEKIRAGALRALSNLSQKGTSIEDIWEEMLTQDPFKAFQALSSFLPKEMLVEIDAARPWVIAHQPLTVEQWQQMTAKQPALIEHDDSGSDAPTRQ